jgi:hypothetical protein
MLAPAMYNYGWGYPMPVFIFIIVLIYSTMSPLILVFGTIYFCLAYLVLKYQLLYGLYPPTEPYIAYSTPFNNHYINL